MFVSFEQTTFQVCTHNNKSEGESSNAIVSDINDREYQYKPKRVSISALPCHDDDDDDEV